MIGRGDAEPPRFRVSLLASAVRDLDEIAAYIGKQSPQNAMAYPERILGRIDGLELLPLANPAVPGTRRVFRCMTVGPHHIFYRVNAKLRAVDVVRILHAHRDPLAMLAALLSER